MAEALLLLTAAALGVVAYTQQPETVEAAAAAAPDEFGDRAQLQNMLNRSLRHADGYNFLNNANINTSMAAALRNPLIRAKGGPMHPLDAARLATAYRALDTFKQERDRGGVISEQFITSTTNVAVPLLTTCQRTEINDRYPFSYALNSTSARPEDAPSEKFPFGQAAARVPISWPLRQSNVSGNVWRNGSTLIQGTERPVPSVGLNTPTNALFANWAGAFGTPAMPSPGGTIGAKASRGILKKC